MATKPPSLKTRITDELRKADDYYPKDDDRREGYQEGVQASLNLLGEIVSEGPYGYLWYTKHMEYRFTHSHPREGEYIGSVVAVVKLEALDEPIKPSEGG